ncbi:hypothetical protein U879_14525 [Defluviimonas sp. 20V17]|uniref:Uncharacterized protein n=1 Tax=Allgaiera indica TaxID=765699 RepID=A0AAN4ZYS4_9RHOB|nr:hypothetical protein [Allgaiera indica]KDB02987.1 hypothetical protein U879_14525 [Defluviimonas sp. 20V17]GHE00718.1 hypothetical protein GCM10008024_13160 [Allgaiera indica]SDW69129.1 hypothetical protein SAMN05444006_1065 [Allgaiera indica]
MPRFLYQVTMGAAAVMALSLAGFPAHAATSVKKECSAQYKAEKAAGKLKPGETWTKFYAACAKANGAKEAGKKPATDSHKPLTTAQKAARKRIKECGAMWRKDKAAGKIHKGETWPQYWHRCNIALKKKG